MALFHFLLFLVLVCICNAITSFSLHECEKSKACFKSTTECTIDSCEFGISWKGINTNGVNFIEFELVGNVYSDNGYILFGFSEDKASGNDGIVGCLVENNTIKIIAGNYDDKSNYVPLAVDQHQDFLIKEGEDKFGGYFNKLTKRIFCRFQRRVTPKIAAFQLKDLSSGNKYYITTVRGTRATEINLEKPLAGSLVISSEPIDFSVSSFYALGGSSPIDSKLAKSHGILMVIAWVFCSSVGIIVARYYKEMWPQTNKIKESTWLQVHRGLQVICLILTTIGFILIFIHVGQYSKLNTFPYKIHPILGIVVFVLTFLNPLIALCRCKPSSRNRPCFNWIHFFIGTIAYCLSVPTIMIGLRLPAAGYALSKLQFPQWILIIFVVFQFFLEIILEIHGCLVYSEDKRKQHVYEMEINEYQEALLIKNAPATLPSPPKQTGRMFRYTLLWFHGIVATLVAIALVVIIIIY